MIGLLRGSVIQKQPPFLLMDVNGVGYEVEAPMSTFYALPAGEQEVTLHIHMIVRDDAHVLYGFISQGDRGLFRALLKVNGVGGKMALAILSGMTADEFALCIQSADVTALTKLPGVGKKTAERLIIEMRDRLEKIETGSSGVDMITGGGQRSASNDAESALLALGYRANEAKRMIERVKTDDMDTEQLIKAALQATTKR